MQSLLTERDNVEAAMLLLIVAVDLSSRKDM